VLANSCAGRARKQPLGFAEGAATEGVNVIVKPPTQPAASGASRAGAPDTALAKLPHTCPLRFWVEQNALYASFAQCGSTNKRTLVGSVACPVDAQGNEAHGRRLQAMSP
jgi:hypothetical protein